MEVTEMGGWDAENPLDMNEDTEYARFEAAAAVLATEIDMPAEAIAELLGDWAMDSQSRSGIIMQLAAHCEFGATLSTYTRGQAERYGICVDADWPAERGLLRAIHNRAGVRSAMTLYRGTSHAEANALESWTTDREIAEFYVGREGGGVVVSRTFAADEILATYQDGIGLECALEVVVINA